VTQSHSRAYRLGEIVERFGGKLIGDPDLEIRRIATLESAGPGDLSFLSHPRYRRQLRSTRASAVILKQADRDATSLPRILCNDPYLYFARVAGLLNAPKRPAPGVHSQAVVEPGAIVAASAAVGPWCHIGRDARIGERVVVEAGCAVGEEVEIGEDSHLHPSVTIYPRCRIGRRAVIHSGVVIGADGFGMALDEGRWLKIPQTGRAIIGDDVEIGANTTIDRGALDDTVVEDGVKLDNQIQIGHNVRIGAHTAMAGCVGIAGSTRIGRHCTVGGGALIVGHIDIADHVNVSAATLVTKSIVRAGTYSGVFPIAAHREWAKTAAHLRGLDRLVGRIHELEKQLATRGKRKR
jgi:UDP-3-O-[3-hydroxymyristoyl] glucosamine N-acyltransferase